MTINRPAKAITALLFFLTGFFHLNCAQGQTERFISGKVIDADLRTPVPYATIQTSSKALTIVTNIEGDFKIPVRYKLTGDSLKISCIGYKNSLATTRGMRIDTVNVIRLVPSATTLNEISFVDEKGGRKRRSKELPAYKIVANAIKSIHYNFDFTPFSYTGYYRDYQISNHHYINLNEGIVEVHDKGFATDDQLDTQIKLVHYRSNTRFPRDSTTVVPYDNKPNAFGKGKNKFIPNAILSPLGGNELSILRLHDAIRNFDKFSFSYVNILNVDFVNNHFFKMERMVFLDTVVLYCISFESRYAVSGPGNFATGKIYIEKGNWAIHKIEYVSFNKTMKETIPIYEIHLEYIKGTSKMHLNYISFNNSFLTRNERIFKVIDIAYNRTKNAFVLDFNNDPDKIFLVNPANYNFMFGDKKLKIRAIQLNTSKQAFIFLDDESRSVLSGLDGNAPALNLKISGLRDVDNREIDQPSENMIKHYRELFVQIVGREANGLKPAEVMDRNRPLSKISVSDDDISAAGYMMNSPLIR